MRYPKDVDVWEYAPGRKLAEVVVTLKNQKGALASCSQLMSDMEVNMLSGFVSAPISSPIARWSFFADLTDAKSDLGDLKKALLANPLVESVDTHASEDGFMVDKKHFPVHTTGRRVIVLRVEAMNEMLFRLWSVFGSGAAAIIDQMAEAMGRQSAMEIVKDFGKDFARRHLEDLLGSYGALGYAEVEIEPSKTADFPILVHARCLFECQANTTRNMRRKSIFFKAHLRGFMAALFDQEFEVDEVQCKTFGDEVCSFHIQTSEKAIAELPWRSPRKSEQGSTSSF